jgi:hypothetical protein
LDAVTDPLARREQIARRIQCSALAVDQRGGEQRSLCRFARYVRLFFGRDCHRFIPAPELEELNDAAGSEVRLPSPVAAPAREGGTPLGELKRLRNEVTVLDYDSEVVLGTQRACVELLCVRPFSRSLEEDASLA